MTVSFVMSGELSRMVWKVDRATTGVPSSITISAERDYMEKRGVKLFLVNQTIFFKYLFVAQ